MKQTPENVRGITERPLFDAVPVCNYLIPILHKIIGIGNDFVDTLLEFIEERVEVLSQKERESRNSVIFAEVKHKLAVSEFNNWLEDSGYTLVDKQLHSQAIASLLAAKVCKKACMLKLQIHFYTKTNNYQFLFILGGRNRPLLCFM